MSSVVVIVVIFVASVVTGSVFDPVWDSIAVVVNCVVPVVSGSCIVVLEPGSVMSVTCVDVPVVAGSVTVVGSSATVVVMSVDTVPSGAVVEAGCSSTDVDPEVDCFVGCGVVSETKFQCFRCKRNTHTTIYSLSHTRG